jgi:hypothetical protein
MGGQGSGRYTKRTDADDADDKQRLSTISIDVETRNLVREECIKREAEIGFRPTVSQMVKLLIKKGLA